MHLPRIALYMALTAIPVFSMCGGAGAQHKNFILVIDPGHGGKDPGATQGRYLEKNLNLDIALALGALVTREIPGVDVLYTRTDDSAVGLAARGDFANRAGADLFLSIHTNANKSNSPNGSETYVMGMDKNEANLDVAKLENEVMRYEKDYTVTYADFDPSSAEMSIIMGMLQYAHFESSLGFARLVQKHYAADTPLRDRGAKQGPFAVLWKPTMPRVLTEMGFISSDADRRYMFSDQGKAAIAKALFEAFREYKAALDAAAAGSEPLLAAVVPEPVTPAPAATSPIPAVTPAPVAAPVTTTDTPAKTTPTPVAAPAPAKATQARPVQNTPASIETPGSAFYIQLAASRGHVSTDDASWGAYRGRVVERPIDGWYKYWLGPYLTQNEAEAVLRGVRANSRFAGAFVVEADPNMRTP